MKARAVFFDLDGTLVDSLPALHKGVQLLAEELKLPDPGIERVGDMIGGGVRVLVGRLIAWWQTAAPECPLPETEAALSRLVELWDAVGTSAIRVYPGVPEALSLLRKAGIRTVLVTNKERKLTLALLEEKGMSGLFDAVVAGGDCARLKPYPDMIERALALSQTAPEEALMVGDSRNDALAARAAGVKALLVETGYNEGEPLAVWGPSNGFENIFPDAAAACGAVLEGEAFR